MKKLVSLILACLLCLAALPAFAEQSASAPKYVFLFIGDGMSYPQFQAAADYLGALADEHLADSDAMDYDMDRADGEWALKDYVAKGIEQLDNETGFFMMCEGGKIDWACRRRDCDRHAGAGRRRAGGH